MPTHNFFGATAADILRRLPGEAGPLAPSLVEAAMEDAEARIEAAMPERYRRLLSRVEGEVIVQHAASGQLTAPIGLPAASNLALYANLRGPYPDRSAAFAMPEDAYQLNETGEYAVFSPGLRAGTRVVADYDTSLAGGIRVLAELLAELAAADLARVAVRGASQEVAARLAAAESRLDALAAGRLGIPELDALRLYDDTERSPRGLRCGELLRS